MDTQTLGSQLTLTQVSESNLDYLTQKLSDYWLELILHKKINKSNFFALLKYFDVLNWPYNLPNQNNQLGNLWEQKSLEIETKAIKKTNLHCPAYKDLMLVLVRPELLSFLDQIIQFISTKNCDLVFSKSILFNQSITFGIYSQDVVKYNKAILTRLKSINLNINQSMVLIFKSNATSKCWSKSFKGVAGYYQKNTLRGDIVYELVNQMYSQNKQLFHSAFDPTGMFQYCMNDGYLPKLTKRQQDNIYLHHGVHLPLFNELAKDMGTLLNDQELRFLNNL